MPNRIERLLSNLDKWVSLGDLFNKNNVMNSDVLDFLQTFSSDKILIFISNDMSSFF